MAAKRRVRTGSVKRPKAAKPQPYTMVFDPGTVKHLGLQMYSTLPPVIGELVSNAWDADATTVKIEIPTKLVTAKSEIVITDNGTGMNDSEVRDAYLTVGRDRRREEQTDVTPGGRPLMARKGIGKFSPFGIAHEVEIETIKKGQVSRFVMDYQQLENPPEDRTARFDPIAASGKVKKGTRVTLRKIVKFRTKSIPIPALRRGLARRFSVMGKDFKVSVNGREITAQERDLKRLLEKGADAKKYLWEFDDIEVESGTGWKVSGWIGALRRTDPLEDGIQRGIVIMARGKLVQEPFVFNAVVGQQFALSYLVGELHAEFVDSDEDTIGTARSSLVWDTDRNQALLNWGQKEVNRIARDWAERRRQDNERKLEQNPAYKKFLKEADRIGNKRAKKVADNLIRNVINRSLVEDETKQDEVVQLCLDYVEFDTFWELAEEITEEDDPARIASLFREWEIVEAREMARVTEGRIETIKKLQQFIEQDAKEVPTIHEFLREFPWVLDPRWTLVADEKRYSDVLKEKFPDAAKPEKDRRIDFLCVKEDRRLVVVEIKRPGVKASLKEMGQLKDYVHYMREHTGKTSDPDTRIVAVDGILLCGDVVGSYQARQERESLSKDGMYIRLYADLLGMVEKAHKSFLEQYDKLRKAKVAEDAKAEPKS